MKKIIILKTTLVSGLLLLCSCSAVNQGIAILRTPKNFVDIGNQIRIESKNDELFGKDVGDIEPYLIDSVEKKTFHKFVKMPLVYICNTNKSFCKYSGARYPGPRARVTPKGLFISPRLKSSKDWKDILYHELCHVILLQHTKVLCYVKIPIWFHEGLATLISNGGGSGNVTDSASIIGILNGNHFNPVQSENVLLPKSFSKDNIPPWTEYRQSMLFVKFIKEINENKFKMLLDSIFNKNSFPKSIEISYDRSISELWKNFVEKLKSNRSWN